MTSSVKERLTGALILIVALVIVVPELFSGRPAQQPTTDAPEAQAADAGPPLRSYTMDLAAGKTVQSNSNPQPAPAPAPKLPETAPAAQASPPPVIPAPALPAAKSPATSPPVEKPVSQPPAKPVADAKPPAETPAVQAHGWWVQLGSFSARANADRLAEKLSSAGYSLRVSPTISKGKELYRVLAGPSPDRAAAAELQARLAAAGHKGTLVAP